MRYLIGIIVAAVAIALPFYWAFARDAALYSAQCCRGTAEHGDCEPLPYEAVSETAYGYRVDFISPTQGAVHEVVPYGSPNVWDSKDGRYHVCLRPSGYPNSSRVRCFYRTVNF